MSDEQDDKTGQFLPGNNASKGTGGRRSTYDPSYCGDVIDFMAQGYSVTAFAGHIRVARSTIYEWAKAHPEFSDALNVGQAASGLWWENLLRKNAQEGEGNATPVIFALKNRAADDWRDKQTVEHQGGLSINLVDNFVTDNSE